MLSKRDKLYVLPWEKRRFQHHKNKVANALPAIDSVCPPNRPHLFTKLKKNQFETDRKEKILKDNFTLLQRLSAIMKVNRLDNHWKKAQPDFHHKVGLYFPVQSYRSTLSSARSTGRDGDTFERPVKCFACEANKKAKDKEIFNIVPLEEVNMTGH